ncbi:MAG: FixH family protein [Ekhidna sp.]
MNWGKSIVLAFVLFAAFILFMVVRAFQEDFDLVAEDYYAQEIGYQKKLEQKANYEKLDTKVLVQLNAENVSITFPEDQQPKGEIHVYHPSHKALDKRFEINTTNSNQQVVSMNEFIQGQYRINITWESGGVEYFQQEKIYIN